MLKKEVCGACCLRHWGVWSVQDSEHWDTERIVPCPSKFNASWGNVDDKPPVKCPYRLEHMILGDKDIIWRRGV